jgi:hypothetical protein
VQETCRLSKVNLPERLSRLGDLEPARWAVLTSASSHGRILVCDELDLALPASSTSAALILSEPKLEFTDTERGIRLARYCEQNGTVGPLVAVSVVAVP